MKKSFFYIMATAISLLTAACNSGPQTNAAPTGDTTVSKAKSDTVVIFVGINSKGVGRFKNIKLSNPLNQSMVTIGKSIFETKCFACHKLTTEMLVGPGWSGVTRRRTPEWIMNWITNTKIMLDKDLAAQADMAVCLIRMPNQDLTDEQARAVLEFMRSNDGER
jgi:mono/diheme cytochrome c family protein